MNDVALHFEYVPKIGMVKIMVTPLVQIFLPYDFVQKMADDSKKQKEQKLIIPETKIVTG
jgi:hypothetical protein